MEDLTMDMQVDRNPLSKNHDLYKTGFISTGMAFIVYYCGNAIFLSSMSPDVRQNDWVVMKSPLPILVISVVYAFFVTWLGPLFMKRREKFKYLRHIMIIFNFSQVILNGYIMYLGFVGGWNGSYSFRCELCDFSNNPQAIIMVHACYWYFISKLTELFDTVFHVLNKKYESISVLHVTHHTIMPINVYFAIRYYPGGHGTFLGLVHAPLHLIRYFYFGISVLGPQYRKYLWWKNYLTMMQVIMIVLVIVHEVQMAFISCPVPATVSIWAGGNGAMFFLMFLVFYIKAQYKRKEM